MYGEDKNTLFQPQILFLSIYPIQIWRIRSRLHFDSPVALINYSLRCCELFICPFLITMTLYITMVHVIACRSMDS